MNMWYRKVGLGAVALTLAGVLGGCNNGDGGSILLYFGINGSGSCNNLVVEVDLSEAGAVLERDEVGNAQCDINSALEQAGCDITFQELEGGLRATVSGCTIPAVTNVFRCVFTQVDISELQETASSQCTCKTPGCDTTPPVCISEDPDPTSCEDCDNGIDDDGNGLTDCDDPNCENSPLCEPTTTTTSTSTTVTIVSTSTTNTTTTTESTTTSTTLVPQLTCTVIFKLDDDVTAGALQWTTDYSNAPGFLLGQGGNVECAGLIVGAIPAFNDIDAEESLNSGIVSLNGFTGPVNIAECTMKAFTKPEAADFVIEVTEASNPNLDPISPLPDVSIASIECDGVEDTTTTTTAPPDTTTTTLGDGGGPQDYLVKYRLDSASASVGALQWSTDYSGATGEFQGSGATPTCTANVALGALFAPNDIDAEQKLNLGLVALVPFAAPVDLVTCTFNGDSGDAPTPGDFPITIEDKTDGNGDPIDAAISVTVTPAP